VASPAALFRRVSAPAIQSSCFDPVPQGV